MVQGAFVLSSLKAGGRMVLPEDITTQQFSEKRSVVFTVHHRGRKLAYRQYAKYYDAVFVRIGRERGAKYTS